MTEAITDATVNTVLSAAFVDGAPEWATKLVGQLVDSKRLLGRGKFGVGLGSSGGSVWVSAEPDERSFSEVIRDGWGEASAFLSSADPGITQYLLQVSSDGARLLGTRREPQVGDDGVTNVGIHRDLVSGDAGLLTMHDAAPLDLFEGQSERVAAMGQLPEGPWLVCWREGTAITPILMLSVPDAGVRTTLEKTIDAAGTLFQAAEQAEITVAMAVVEVGEVGDFDLSCWLSWGVQIRDELPEIFSGGVPDIEAFAASFDGFLLEKDRPAVRELVAKRIYSQLIDGADEDAAHGRLSDLWMTLHKDLSLVPPFERPALVDKAVGIADILELQQRSTCVAAARYLADHEHADAPPFEIPSQLTAMSVDELLAEADTLLASLPAAREMREATAHYAGLNELVNLVAVEANLNAAKSGSFLAAEGAIHTYLLGLGPLGYDNDSSLAGLDGVDLESDDDDLSQAFLDGDL